MIWRQHKYNAVRSSQESVAENHETFGKVPCLCRFQTRRQAPKMNCTLPVPYGIGSLVVSRFLTFYDNVSQEEQQPYRPYHSWRIMSSFNRGPKKRHNAWVPLKKLYAAFLKPIKMSCTIPISNNTGWQIAVEHGPLTTSLKMSTLVWLKDQKLKPSETQLPVSWKPSCQAQISSNSKWHCHDNRKPYHEDYDMSMIWQYKSWDMNVLKYFEYPSDIIPKKTTPFKRVFKFLHNHGVSTAIAASTGSHRGCEGLWQWNVAAAGTATTAGACDAWRKRWLKVTVLQAESVVILNNS